MHCRAVGLVLRGFSELAVTGPNEPNTSSVETCRKRNSLPARPVALSSNFGSLPAAYRFR